MKHSKKIVAATADRMISFYDFCSTSGQRVAPLTSRIENLVAVPHCLEYYEHPDAKERKKDSKEGDSSKRLETLFVGDDLGIVHMYDFEKPDWHYCALKPASSQSKNPSHM